MIDIKKVDSEDRCNGCSFRLIKLGKPAKWNVEQIVKGARISLCTFHLFTYMAARFKWWLNDKSGYRLEKITKWWIR